MALFKTAQITSRGVKIGDRNIEKADAVRRIKDGKDVWGTKSNAHSLAESLCVGQGSMRHAPHVLGGYHHYHDENHVYNGHIFYGGPS